MIRDPCSNPSSVFYEPTQNPASLRTFFPPSPRPRHVKRHMMNADFLRSNFEGSSFVWTRFKTHPLLSIIGLPLLTLDLILLPFRAVAWRKSSICSCDGDCDSHAKQDKRREGRKEKKMAGSRSEKDRYSAGQGRSSESLAKETGRTRRDGVESSESERYYGSSHPSSGRHRRRRSGGEYSQNEKESNEDGIRRSRGNRLRAEEAHDASPSTQRHGRARMPRQLIYGDERPSQPLWENTSRSGPASAADDATLPCTTRSLSDAGSEEAPAAASIEQMSVPPPTQDIHSPSISARNEQSNSERSSRHTRPSSRPSTSAPSSSATGSRRTRSNRSSWRSQSLRPPSSMPRQGKQQQGFMDPIPESRYDSDDEEVMSFPSLPAARRAEIEGWKGGIVAGVPAPPSSVQGGREDGYDELESVGWWESSSQQMKGSVGTGRTGNNGTGYSDQSCETNGETSSGRSRRTEGNVGMKGWRGSAMGDEERAISGIERRGQL